MEIDSDPLLLEGIKRSIASKDINAPFTPRTIALEAKLHCPPPLEPRRQRQLMPN